MTDLEFDILDELYFVIAYDDLQKILGIDDEELKQALINLHQKGWIKCFDNISEELSLDEVDLKHSYRHYFYLASKEGLMAHNRS
jgi:transcription initiation factor IIE alpha subunit